MTYQELYETVKRCTYKRNSFISILPRAELDVYEAEIKLSQQLPNAKFPVEHPVTIGLVKKITRKDLAKMTELDFMKLLRGWWSEFEQHEVDEWLQLDGRTVVDPHPQKRIVARQYPVSAWRRVLDRWRATA